MGFSRFDESLLGFEIEAPYSICGFLLLLSGFFHVPSVSLKMLAWKKVLHVIRIIGMIHSG